MQLRPRSLILNVLLAAGNRGQAVRELIGSCALFGMRENSVRVALVRLAADGLVEVTERGRYRLGSQASALASDVATWRTAEDRVREWQGQWIAAHVARSRSDRRSVRDRSRALALLGMRELERDLYLRPDNLAGGVAAARERLQRLGLDAAATVFLAQQFDADHEARARRLWDGAALNRAYRATRRRLEQWGQKAARLAPDVAARDAFMLGNEAIRLLVFDPMLPAPLVDVVERRAFTAAVLQHEKAGRAHWRRLRLAPESRDVAPPRSFEFDPLQSLGRAGA
jgi:phenylacetic acid degradation operon negative regulatory protein